MRSCATFPCLYVAVKVTMDSGTNMDISYTLSQLWDKPSSAQQRRGGRPLMVRAGPARSCGRGQPSPQPVEASLTSTQTILALSQEISTAFLRLPVPVALRRNATLLRVNCQTCTGRGRGEHAQLVDVTGLCREVFPPRHEALSIMHPFPLWMVLGQASREPPHDSSSGSSCRSCVESRSSSSSPDARCRSICRCLGCP